MSECRRRSRAAAGLELKSDFSHKSLEAREEGGADPPAGCLYVCPADYWDGGTLKSKEKRLRERQ